MEALFIQPCNIIGENRKKNDYLSFYMKLTMGFSSGSSSCSSSTGLNEYCLD